MPIAWEKVLPVLISCTIIVGIAIIREYSKTVAAITATMPVTIPLSLWIIYAAEGGERAAVTQYTDALLMGIVPTVVFLVVAWWVSRAGWSLIPIVVAGYTGWAVTLGVLLGLRRLLGGG
jgi:mannose/fructose/N-acetylgalactosamine-specific phosphotransferase system component IID